MADAPIRSAALAVPHAFLTAQQSAREDYAALGATRPPVFVKQVHSAQALVVDGPFAQPLPEADALVTAVPGLPLAIVTADCAPVLLADTRAGVVGAAHAGWRGAHGGVLEATVEAMEQLGARRESIHAAIGPCIAQPSYEVDEAFRDRFAAADARYFAPGAPGHFQFDLPGYVAARLAAAGVAEVDALGIDTYTQRARFHSFRRATHERTPTQGRQFSLIAMPVRAVSA